MNSNSDKMNSNSNKIDNNIWVRCDVSRCGSGAEDKNSRRQSPSGADVAGAGALVGTSIGVRTGTGVGRLGIVCYK